MRAGASEGRGVDKGSGEAGKPGTGEDRQVTLRRPKAAGVVSEAASRIRLHLAE